LPPKILIYRVNLGIIPGFGGTQRFSRRVGVGKAKKLINENQEIKKGLEKEINLFARYFATQDRLEGINAFLEKRKPKFKGI